MGQAAKLTATMNAREPADSSSREFKWTSHQISIVLTIVAVMLWCVGIANADFQIGHYGLIHSFPPIFFVSIGILTLASAILWTSKESHGRLLFIQLCILIISFWLVPAAIGGAHPYMEEYYSDLGIVEYINRTGQFDASGSWFLNWPAGYIFEAITFRIIGLETDSQSSIIPLVPMIWQILILIPMYVFFKRTIGTSRPNLLWAGLWIFYLGDWVATFSLGAEAFGAFFVLGLMAVVTLPFNRIGKYGMSSFKLIVILLMLVLAFTHLLGSIVGLALGAALLFTYRGRRASRIVIIGTIIIVAWSMFGAESWFDSNLSALVRSSAFNTRDAAEVGFLERLTGGLARADVNIVRVLFSVLFVMLTSIGILLSRKLKSSWDMDKRIFIAGVACIAAMIAVGSGYHEVFVRFFLFALPVIGYFSAKLLYFRATRIFLFVILIIAVPLSFVAQYGNQKLDYLSPGYLSAATFFHDETTGGNYTAHMPIGQMKNLEKYSFYNYGDVEWPDGVPYYREYKLSPHYISLSDHDRAWFDYYENKIEAFEETFYQIYENDNYVLSFVNSNAMLFLHEE